MQVVCWALHVTQLAIGCNATRVEQRAEVIGTAQAHALADKRQLHIVVRQHIRCACRAYPLMLQVLLNLLC